MSEEPVSVAAPATTTGDGRRGLTVARGVRPKRGCNSEENSVSSQESSKDSRDIKIIISIGSKNPCIQMAKCQSIQPSEWR